MRMAAAVAVLAVSLSALVLLGAVDVAGAANGAQVSMPS
jgi:hypothetical protein